MTTTARRLGRIVLFWVLTAPLVLLLTYFVVEQLGGLDTSLKVTAAYLLAQVAYILLIVGVLRLVRGYRSWIAALST